MTAPSDLSRVRMIADAVLYEGYLLYPYRASSSKNQSRWQFGVLGPPDAASEAFAEAPHLAMQCLVAASDPAVSPTVAGHLRFLHRQDRVVEKLVDGVHVPVAELDVDGIAVTTWHEAVECEVALPVVTLGGGAPSVRGHRIEVAAAEDITPVVDAGGATRGRIVRRRTALHATVDLSGESDDGYARLSIAVVNAHPERACTKDDALRLSLIGAHLVLVVRHGDFVSLLEPPDDAVAAVARCHQDRCYPVLAGAPGVQDVVLGSPIILYDHPEIAAESAGALFDSTEIDEILTLRVMTMTDAEKAEARATDPRAADIIARCDAMSPEALQQLHGVLRDPQSTAPPGGPDTSVATPASFDTGAVPWWDPATDESVRPDTDSVVIDGVDVARGSLVRVHPSRRADAQDLFFADQVARVTAVLSDVDGSTHVALVLVDDPAADLHEEAGRFLYFAPDELEPLDRDREETCS